MASSKIATSGRLYCLLSSWHQCPALELDPTARPKGCCGNTIHNGISVAAKYCL